MNFVTENITPIKAQEYLKTSLGNRPISKPTVQSYADTMKKGGWMMNGVAIIFDVEGHLIDGHHRMHAVILAGIPVKMEVCRGVPSEAFTTYDCGRRRNLGQLLAMQKVKNYNLVASIVSVNYTLVRTGKIWSNNNTDNGKKTRTNEENYELFQRDPQGFINAGEDAMSVINKVRGMLSGSWIGGLIYYLTHTGGYEKEYVIHFFENVCSYDDGDIQPANVLRKRILDNKIRNVSLLTSQLFAFIVISWNAYVQNRTLSFLRYNPDKEEFPQLILKENQ